MLEDKNTKKYAKVVPFGARMYHGKAVDAIAYLGNKTTNAAGDITYIKTEDETVTLDIRSSAFVKKNTEVHKLLSRILIDYTEKNNYKKRNKTKSKDDITIKKRQLDIKISIKEYLELKGYKTEKEDGLLNSNNIKQAKKELKKAATALDSISVEWTENTGEKYHKRRLFSGFDIDSKYLTMRITEDFADYLDSCPLTTYPTKLLSLGAENENAYRIGYKLSNHYRMRSNIIRKSNNRLKIKNILHGTSIKVESIIQNDKKHWQRRIKETLEKNLDKLDGVILNNWKYTSAKGQNINIINIRDVEEYLDLYIEFELLNG